MVISLKGGGVIGGLGTKAGAGGAGGAGARLVGLKVGIALQGTWALLGAAAPACACCLSCWAFALATASACFRVLSPATFPL